MQKILFVITKSNWGGAQRYVFDLATSLPKEAWNVGVVLGGTGAAGASGGRLEDELRHRDMRTLFVPAFMRDISLNMEWRAFRHLWDLFAIEQPDVVHLNSSKAGGLGALAARFAGVPNIVFTVHGMPWQEDRGLVSRGLILLTSWITFILSHRVIAISSDAYERIGRMPLCRRKVRLVHNGIAPLQFAERAEARKALLPEAGDTFIIGAVGELTWNKGYHVLLRAVRRLKSQGRHFIVCIIGEGDERKFLETMVEEENLSDFVHFAGFIPDAYTLLKAFDLFVLSSVKEGLPYVLIEAGQAGLPVVASKVGGVADIIGDRISGLRFTAKNHNDLADHIAEMMDNPGLRLKLSEGLREHIEKEFSIPRMIAGTLAAYRG